MQDEDEYEVEDQLYLLCPGQTVADLVVYLSYRCGFTNVYVYGETSAYGNERKTAIKFETVPGTHDYRDYGTIEDRLVENSTKINTRENIIDEPDINDVLTDAFISRDNVLIFSDPGTSTLAKIRNGCAKGPRCVVVSAKDPDVLKKLDSYSMHLSNRVLVIDEYDRAKPMVRAKLFSIISEHTYGQSTTVAICYGDGDFHINDAEYARFTHMIDYRLK
jgi:hypothetical protein